MQNERIRRACGRAVVVRSVADVQAVLEHIDREVDDGAEEAESGTEDRSVQAVDR